MLNYIYNLATDKDNGLLASLIKIFLYALSLAYGMIIRLLIFFYALRPYQAGCKVISVGNITLGGTGKTPLVEYLAARLKGRGRKIAVVTRGYLSQDEPQMLEANLSNVPVIVDADRRRGIKRGIAEYGVDTVVLDDGFQQWRIKKDLDIVVIDSQNPFGNRQMIPRGILRQPLSSLKSAQVFVLTKTDLAPQIDRLKDFLRGINPGAVITESRHAALGFYELGKKELLAAAAVFKEKPVALLSGIGDPDYFAHSVKGTGIKIGLAFEFPDHYAYSSQDLDKIITACGVEGLDAIVTTEKDAVKLRKLQITNSAAGGPAYGWHKLQIFVLRSELQITKNEQGLLERLFKLYGA
ncbi:MAG: tetraacyldisaccharide 4'-kinase [Candidatus Omnitrophota bacterium]